MSPNAMDSMSGLGATDPAHVVGKSRPSLSGGKVIASEDSMKTDQLLSIPASRFNKGQATEEVLASKVLNHALVHDEEEDYGKLMRVNTEAPFETLIESHLNEERANGMLIKRSMQANIHAAYTQQRIKELEEKLNEVRKDLYKLPDDFNLRKGKRIHPTFRHVLQRSSPAQFNLTRESMDLPEKDRPALEVLVIERLKSPETQPDSRVHHRRPTGLLEDPSYTYQVPERLRIRPRPLIAHLQRVTHIHISDELGPGISGIKQSSIVFLRPFKLLVTYEEQIRQSLLKLEKENHERSIRQEGRAQKEEDEKTFNFEDLLQDLKLLVDFLDGDLRPTFDLREKIRDGTATDIEYHDLWHLFRHGDIVTVESDPSHAYRVVNFGGGREPLVDQLPEDRNLDKQSQPFLDGMMIDCVSIKYDGSNYVPHLDTFSIRSYSGRQPITSLPVYPFRFNEDSVSLKQALIAQGMRYLDVTIPPQSHKHLAGRTLDEPPHDIDAQVIIDTSMALNKVPNWRPQTDKIYKDQLTKGDPRETRIPSYCRHYTTPQGCCGGDVAFKDLQIDALNLNKFFQASPYLMSPRTHIRLAEEDMTLLPDNVHGFVLRNRQWITLRVADLSEARFESVFDELMLPERHKSTIQALVQVHESAVTRTGNCRPTIGNGIDLVRGKGAGLILLLHGEPGVGKTSTAECVADHTKRPLFPITCGDIGETATEVEKNLHYNFSLAHKWGCVLLLDEADVFLAKRNKTDLRRNAVTSVFLRSLEYYAGILFLTTNRVGSIDPAFKSRIHMSLFYPKFDLEATLRLYSTYIKRTRTEQERAKHVTFKIKEKEILKFAKRHFRRAEKEGLGTWNGRQIRNAFQAAIALVEYDSQQTKEGDPKPALGEPQFSIVAESSREFDSYLISTLGAAESDIARREEWRFDRFGNMETKQPPMPRSHDRQKAGFYGKAHNIDDDTSSDDDDDDGDDDDDSNKSDTSDNGFTKRQSRKKARAAVTNEVHDETEQDFKEFQEFMKQKRARKNGK